MTEPADRFQTVADWVDGLLPAEQGEAVAARIAGGEPQTVALVEWLRSVTGTGREFPLEQPPPIMRQRLVAEFERWHRVEAELAAEIHDFDAAVLFDSRDRSLLAGARGTMTDDVVHLAFTTDVADLVLDVRRVAGHRLRIDGQVLPADPREGTVFEAVVTGPGFSIRTADGDDLGRFRLDDVPDDAQQLHLTDGKITVVARLDLRPDGP